MSRYALALASGRRAIRRADAKVAESTQTLEQLRAELDSQKSEIERLRTQREKLHQENQAFRDLFADLESRLRRIHELNLVFKP